MERKDKVAELNARLKKARTLGDVEGLIREGEEWMNQTPSPGTDWREYDRIVLTSKRAVWHTGRRELLAFTGSRIVYTAEGYGLYDNSSDATRLAYLYDDAENHGECDAARLYYVAEFV